MTDTIDRLDERLASTLDNGNYYGHEEETGESWTIQSHDAAEWAADKVAAAHRELAQIDAWEKRAIERVKRAADAERRGPQGTIDFLGGHLAAYLTRLVGEGRRRKTLDLPAGRVSIRARPPALVIEDEATALADLRGTEYVRVRESIDRTALRKSLAPHGDGAVLTHSGEVVRWARLEPQEESWTFTPAEPEGDA